MHGVNLTSYAISMSWGGTEFSSQNSMTISDSSSYGAVFFASSGDNGAGVSWPSSSVNVVSVGGTTLTQGTTGYTENAWQGSGGGVSRFETKPSYQSSLSYSKRATPDVSYNGDPNTGFLVYAYGAWYGVGGTSAGSPQWAAIQALGNSAKNHNFYTDYAKSYSS